jgi:pyruvate ferredoxin oxidoreductase gamma subunit
MLLFYYMRTDKDTIEIVFYARGGQGAKTATEIVAQAAVLEGKFVKAFPDFGPERSGAPIRTYLRISEQEIKTQEPISNPDYAIILDETIFSSQDVLKNLIKSDVLLVNSKKTPLEIADNIKYKGKIFSIDASGISAQIVGKPTPNVGILGKLIKISEIAKIENVIEIFKSIFSEKIGEDLTSKNILTIEKTYDEI